MQAMSEMLAKDLICEQLKLAPSMGKLRAILYESNAVIGEKLMDNGDFILEVRIPRAHYLRILKAVKIKPSQLNAAR